MRSTDVDSKMPRARCKQRIQGQNALNAMQIVCLSSQALQILRKEEISAAKNAQSTDSKVFFPVS